MTGPKSRVESYTYSLNRTYVCVCVRVRRTQYSTTDIDVVCVRGDDDEGQIGGSGRTD